MIESKSKYGEHTPRTKSSGTICFGTPSFHPSSGYCPTSPHQYLACGNYGSDEFENSPVLRVSWWGMWTLRMLQRGTRTWGRNQLCPLAWIFDRQYELYELGIHVLSGREIPGSPSSPSSKAQPCCCKRSSSSVQFDSEMMHLLDPFGISRYLSGENRLNMWRWQ